MTGVGRRLHQPPATARNPFGDVLGFMDNPHYVEVAAALAEV